MMHALEDGSEEEFDRTSAQNNVSKNSDDFEPTRDENPSGFFESDMEDFGSTVSLASSYSLMNSIDSNTPKDKPSTRVSRLDPQVYRKHRERNISLRYNLAEKLLKPVIATSIKKIDKLSQNVSNYQVNMQDALFQSRIATANLLKLQQQLEKFVETDFLKELRIDIVKENEEQQQEGGGKEKSSHHQNMDLNIDGLVVDIQNGQDKEEEEEEDSSIHSKRKNVTLPVPL